MFDDEKSRLKNLLISSIVLYILSGVISWGLLKPVLYDFKNLNLVINYPWALWILVFIVFTWIPVSLWLIFQAVKLKNQMKVSNYVGDRSIVNLSIVIPGFYWLTYLLSRFLEL